MFRVLFACVANSARSQMAEALARQIWRGLAVDVQSAGSQPTLVNPLAVTVLEEVDLDISEQYSKSILSIDMDQIDLVIILCEQALCPMISPRIPKVFWTLPDLATIGTDYDTRIEAYRLTRDKLVRKIKDFKIETLLTIKENQDFYR